MLSPSSRHDSQSCSGLCCKKLSPAVTIKGLGYRVISSARVTSSSTLVRKLEQGWGQ